MQHEVTVSNQLSSFFELDKEAEFEWFDLTEVNEIVVPDLNESRNIIRI